MENVILGLLLLCPRTIYQLKKRIDEGLNLMYSCSTGSIQVSLKKLLRGGFITVAEMSEGGKTKKLYSITDKGKEKFLSWVNGAIDGGAVKNPELAKVYFLGFSQKENRTGQIEARIKGLQQTLAELEKICKEGESLNPQDNDILFFQLQTAKYGRDLMRFTIGWYENLLRSIQ